MPVLFVLKEDHNYGREKAYLHDQESSAHPEEKEFLIGDARWYVSSIGKETHQGPGGPLEVTVIQIRDSRI